MMKKIAILVVLILLVIGTFWFFSWLFTKKPAPATTPANVVEQRIQSNDAVLQAVAKTDEDFDGLTTDDEKKYKTDPKNPDSDSDTLLDGDEVNRYKTDPLKPDSDGDGVIDGLEVRRGLNPRGPGKLTN